MFKNIVKAASAVICSAALLFGMAAAPANAANQDKVRETGEFIYYYSPKRGGAWSDFTGNVPSLTGYGFIGGRGWDGYGQALRNNAASVDNLNPYRSATVYYSPNYVGTSVSVRQWAWRNLDVLRNDNASHKFI
jgi:hypothetical protein